MSKSPVSEFPFMSDRQVQKLRGSDPAIKAIQSRTAPISFHWTRETFKRDNDAKDSLDYGKAILSAVDQLDQYLYTYGKMIQGQWGELLGTQVISPDPIRIIDYGCGQGLAGLMIRDHFGSKFSSKVREIILIEPSEVAVVRAEAVYRNLFPNAEIRCLNRKLDDITKDHFPQSDIRTVHIFSNILDIPDFDISGVLNTTLTNGDHTILAVSHNRDFAGGAGRIKGIKAELDKSEYRGWLKVRNSSIQEFNCGDGGKFAAISWTADLGVKHA